MATGGGNSTSLQHTPTWALATVCFVFIYLSILIEHLIHRISNWLKKHRQTALYEAVEKLKSVLMVLGFMSLILTVTQRFISKICVPIKAANTMLPCRGNTFSAAKTTTKLAVLPSREHSFHQTIHLNLPHRLLLASSTDQSTAGYNSDDHCGSKGMTSLMSEQGLTQLNIFIFVLAVMQIVYSVATMALGRAKMRRWKGWEKETRTVEYQAANDPNRFRLTRQTTFGRRHMRFCTDTSLQLWTKCFFQQFFSSVAKVDYLTLRHGFVSAHLSANSAFDFQRYIQRSLEDDFKVVVGISPLMWFIVVVFLLVDVHGWNMYLWVSFLPLFIVLVVGTKLQVVVARMALQIKDRSNVIKGSPLVQPNDDLFWFSHPTFVLTLLHYTLFMNAFEVAFFIWVTIQFGIKSCYHEHKQIIIVRMVLAVTVQFLCSYITLPLYALVTQMGSNFKSAVLEKETANALIRWHAVVRDKRKKERQEQESTAEASQSNGWSGKGAVSSPDLSTSHNHHHRSPTLSETPAFPSTTTEILEEDNSIHHLQNHPQIEVGSSSSVLVTSSTTVPEIEMSQTNNH